MFMRKKWACIFAVVIGDLVLGFFDGGDSGKAGGAAGFIMVGDGVMA